VVKASPFYGSNTFKYSVGSLGLTMLFMALALPALVYPSFLNRDSVPVHNIFMAGAGLAISSLQVAFVAFMWFFGAKLVDLLPFDQDHILEVKQRVTPLLSLFGPLFHLPFPPPPQDQRIQGENSGVLAPRGAH